MAVLHTKVKLYLEANSKTWEEEKDNILLQNDSDGNGDYIKTWSVSGLAQPTDEQLTALDSQADTSEANNFVIGNREKAYGGWKKQIENIIENGLESEQARVAQIKLDNPKN